MDTDITDTNVLLKHDPEYGVLICLKCRYAVQKSALDSHVLRHKIYREERKRLVASVSNLNILEPDEVPVPAPSSPALAYITKFSGLRCTVSQCGHLTMSTKRMKLHWKQDHGSLGLPTRDSDLARDVILQTFFRGNKVKYFEVESAHTIDIGSSVSHDSVHSEASDKAVQSYAPTERHAPIPSIEPETSLPGPPDEPDMIMLRYFHHFATTTSRTLPYSRSSLSQERYWHEAVIPQALQHRWLMHGLLAISACHMAASATDPVTKKSHCEHEAQYASKFHSRAKQSVLDEDVEQMGDRVRCLLHLAEIALHQPSPDRARDARQDRPIVVSLRGCLRPGSTIMASPTWPGEKEATEDDDPPKGPLEGLQTLRTRMFELLGRPANISDALTILKSIELLQEICNSFGSPDGIESCWVAAASWLEDVPQHFHAMVDDQEPIALLMMAYWSAIMVARVESQGCWILKGAVKASVLHIADRLTVEKHPLLPLIADFGVY